MHLIKTSDEPFYCFPNGGAGVGKSVVTKAFYQAALKYYNQRAGVDYTQVKVVLLAPVKLLITSKAIPFILLLKYLHFIL